MVDGSGTGSTEESAAFLQRRVAAMAAILFAVGCAFLVQRLVQASATGSPSTWRDTPTALHVVGTLLLGALLAATATGTRSVRFVRAAELALLPPAVAAFLGEAAAMPQVFRPNFTMLLVASLVLLVRAVWVPSTAALTLLHGALVGAPLLAWVWRMYETIDPAVLAAFEAQDVFFRVTPENVRLDNLVATAMWFAVTLVVAAMASDVIHGLRRAVRHARQLGQYVLEEKLGEGGMGIVYRAQHALLRRPTAVKVLPPDRVGPRDLARFAREVQAAARLRHPNSVTVYDYGRTPDGVFYYAMELLEGATLTELVRASGPLPPGRVVHLAHQIASALAEAHAQGLVHRDVKPDNVVVTRHGESSDVAKVIDYGLVKELELRGTPGLTAETAVVGTPAYMAPEAIHGRAALDGRSDLYSLGATLFYLLVGEPPFLGTTAVEVCSAHLLTPPDRPSARLGEPLPADLEALVMRCLSKDPEGRFASAEALMDALEGLGDFGRWTRADAERWWDLHAHRLPSIGRGPVERGKETLEVDVHGRARWPGAA